MRCISREKSRQICKKVFACRKIAFLPYCVCRGDHWSPQTVEKGAFTPWPPLRGGSARRRWGRELYGCPKYFGLWQGSLPPPLRGTSLAEGGQTVKKLHSCLIAYVGATIGRPPAYRGNAFSGTVSCKANGHGRAMLAPTRVFRQSEVCKKSL